MIADTIGSLLRPRASTPDPTDPFWYGGAPIQTSAGIPITPESSMQVAAVFACIRVLAETMGIFPVHVHERTKENGRPARRLASEHPLDRLIHLEPNAWQTSQEFHEMAVAHICLRGNFYGELYEGPNGSVSQIVPRHPDRIKQPIEQLADGTLRYTYQPKIGAPRPIPAHRMWHIKMFSLDGIVGVTPTTYYRNAVALSMAQETHGASQFKNGLIPPFYIKRPQGVKFGPEARDNFRKDWRAMHGGPQNAANPPILEDGMEMAALGMTNNDSQWLESRKFQGVEVARIHRVPPFLIQDLDRAILNNVDKLLRAFLVLTMLSWTRRFEQSGGRDLLADSERFFIRYNYDALLRGDSEARAKFYERMFGMGVLSTNDICELEDRNPIGPDGDRRFYAANNLTPIDQAGRQPMLDQPTQNALTDEPESDDNADEATAMQVGLVVSEMCIDAASRIVAAEVRTLRTRLAKAAENRDRWNVWAMEKLDKHADYIAKTLRPIATASGSRANIEAIASRWCERQREELIGSEDVAGTLDEWKFTKPAELAALLIEELYHAIPAGD